MWQRVHTNQRAPGVHSDCSSAESPRRQLGHWGVGGVFMCCPGFSLSDRLFDVSFHTVPAVGEQSPLMHITLSDRCLSSGAWLTQIHDTRRTQLDREAVRAGVQPTLCFHPILGDRPQPLVLSSMMIPHVVP